MPVVSLCMIVRDEERVLPRCLASVAGAVDEIVVVDTGSTDGTVQVALDHAARVVRYEEGTDPLHFARARNLGLAHARGDVALVLDADETLDAAAVPVVRRLAATASSTGYAVTRRNLRAFRREPAWTDHAVRLFPIRPDYRYRGRVHETVDDAILAAGGRISLSSIVVDHHLPGHEALRVKWARYVDLLREDLAAAPDDLNRLSFLQADLYKLERYDEAIEVAERIAALCPEDFDARFSAALLRSTHGHDPARAHEHLKAALAVRPRDPEALALRDRIVTGRRPTT